MITYVLKESYVCAYTFHVSKYTFFWFLFMNKGSCWASWWELMHVCVQDYPKLSQNYYGLLECLAQDHMSFISNLEPQVFLYILSSISEGLTALGTCPLLHLWLPWVYSSLPLHLLISLYHTNTHKCTHSTNILTEAPILTHEDIQCDQSIPHKRITHWRHITRLEWQGGHGFLVLLDHRNNGVFW